MIIFKILLIILVALPVIALACALFAQIGEYVRRLNSRDRKIKAAAERDILSGTQERSRQ